MSVLGFDDRSYLEVAREHHPLTAPLEWPDGRVAFFESERFGRRIGVLERSPP